MIILILLLFSSLCLANNNKSPSHLNIRKDFNIMLETIKNNYAYFNDKNTKISCIKEHYSTKIDSIKTSQDTVLFFEYILNEFYDSHISLNVNTANSYRLNAPIYAKIEKTKILIKNISHMHSHSVNKNIIGAEILSVNGIKFDTMIEQFPSHCLDKNNNDVKQWIANKILAGRYDQPRIIELKLSNETIIKINPDNWQIESNDQLLSTKVVNDIGIININNSLGNNHLIHAFDQALDNMLATKALIIDLRSTISGGNSYVARAIMGRFVSQDHAYQKHSLTESWDGQAPIKRTWIEYVSPRGITYKKPVIILIDQWTASMGEGLAIGFDALIGATVIGTEMQKLAGAISRYNLEHQKFTYQLSNEKLFHINGTPREQFIPAIYIEQQDPWSDAVMQKALSIINVDKVID